MENTIYRLHYRGSLITCYDEAELKAALKSCEETIAGMIREGKILTAALYYYNRMLFFYYESIGTQLEPEQMMSALTPFLELWPGCPAKRQWAYMYQIFCHAYPNGLEDWKRPKEPELRRGRIAFLKTDKLFSYVYHHKAIVDEGLLCGDKYQSIALHENILFSYFEEPKTLTNIQGKPEQQSKVIEEWIKAVPEEHFIHLPECKGENFMFLPAYFWLQFSHANFFGSK